MYRKQRGEYAYWCKGVNNQFTTKIHGDLVANASQCGQSSREDFTQPVAYPMCNLSPSPLPPKKNNKQKEYPKKFMESEK